MHIKYIQSAQNPAIKQAITLHTKKGRDSTGLCIAEGVRVCSTLHNSSLSLERYIITEDMLPVVQHHHAPEILVVPIPLMRKLSHAENPSGVVGIF